MKTKKSQQDGKLTYEDLELPVFLNSSPAVSITTVSNNEPSVVTLTLSDVAKAAVLSGCSFLNIGDTRCGKSRLMRDIHESYFGGDSDNGGQSNWNVARNDFSSEAYFMTLNQDKIGEGKGMLSESRVPVEKRVNSLCNIVDELNLAIPEVQVEFFGMAEGRHKGLVLGNEGYHLFMASCNLNRVNGDFAGTSQINRALLNRFGVSFDFDFFRKTDEDEDILTSRGSEKKVELRDISGKILQAYHEIIRDASEREPFLDAYIRFLSSGLEYCNEDSDKRKKKIWPSRCGNCNFSNKDLCSLIKQSNTGTTQTLKRFAHGLNYLVNLKQGSNLSCDPFDLVTEAFKFTTYHGNLNASRTLSDYYGEDQEQMRDALVRLKDAISSKKELINQSIYEAMEGNSETRFIELTDSGDPNKVNVYQYSEETLKKLEEFNKVLTKKNKPRLNYRISDKFDSQACQEFANETGLRLDWFPAYLKSIANNYKTK